MRARAWCCLDRLCPGAGRFAGMSCLCCSWPRIWPLTADANAAMGMVGREGQPRDRCGRGELGRRKGLKIPRWQRRAGSIPAVRTIWS